MVPGQFRLVLDVSRFLKPDTLPESLYDFLRKYYELPAVTTNTQIKLKVSSSSENTFLHSAFKSLEDNQKTCLILHDEVYVKKMLLYHSGLYLISQ